MFKKNAILLLSLVVTFPSWKALADICPAGNVDGIRADLDAANAKKAQVDTHLQKVHDMLRSVEGNFQTSGQTIDTLNQAESKDLDAIRKLNEQIDADRTCLQTPSCTNIVHVTNISGTLELIRGGAATKVTAICDLGPGDELRTGVNGSADISILNGKRMIHVGPNMTFRMPTGDLVEHLLEDPESQLTTVIGVRG